MENVRLIYEQVEIAKRHIEGDVLECRLALILLDNTAELLLGHALEYYFGLEDFFSPKDRPTHLTIPRTSRYTPKERIQAEREFEPKLRILQFRLNRISTEDRGVLKICHRLRNDAFHRGALRSEVLSQVVRLMYATTVGLTLKLPISSFRLPQPGESGANAAFLERFDIANAMLLGTDDGRKSVADKLMEGVHVDATVFADTLSKEALRRIDENILGGLAYLAEHPNTDMDRNLQYGQFWKDQGIGLAQSGVREPDLERAFIQWRDGGQAKYTVAKIMAWRRRSEVLARKLEPPAALVHWDALDRTIAPLEASIGKAVADYDNMIDAQLH